MLSSVGRPKEHSEATRQALLVAAEKMVEQGGPSALSVRAVADEVGTTTRAVYSVFGSKDGLLEALAIRLFELLGDAIEAVPTTKDPLTDIVVASIKGFRAVALAHPSLYSLVFLRVVPDLQLGNEFAEVAQATFGRLEQLVLRAAKSHGFTVPPPQVANMIHALTEGLATMELRGALADVNAEQQWRDAVNSLLRGLIQS
jgi:AcrR family transcriptional regulator